MIMGKTLISIIIPVYNTPRAQLKRCIDSVLSQTYENYEVIIIDDGSNCNETKEYISVVEQLDTRMNVYHISNSGVSHARNLGIETAKGKYVFFVDSDDYVSPNMLEQAIDIAIKYDIDIVYGAVLRVYKMHDCSGKVSKTPLIEVLDKKGHELLRRHLLDNSAKEYIFSDGSRIHRGPTARMIKTEIIRDILFPEGIAWCEDIIWNQGVIDRVQNVAITDSVWYYYAQNSQSVTHSFNPRTYSNIRAGILRLKNKVVDKHQELQRSYDGLLQEYLQINILNSYLLHKDNKYSVKKRNEEFKRIIHEEPFNRVLHCPLHKSMKFDQKVALISYHLPMVFYIFYFYSNFKLFFKNKHLN